MPKNLAKITKKLTKKKGKLDKLHENSRDAQRLRRASGREDKLLKMASAATTGRQLYVDRVAFFQAALGENSGVHTNEEMLELIKTWISRGDEELEQLKAEQRKGRPPTKREEALTQRAEHETKELESGFWTPDLSDELNIAKLMSMTGGWDSLNNLQYIRLTGSGVRHESSFPPKGLS